MVYQYIAIKRYCTVFVVESRNKRRSVGAIFCPRTRTSLKHSGNSRRPQVRPRDVHHASQIANWQDLAPGNFRRTTANCKRNKDCTQAAARITRCSRERVEKKRHVNISNGMFAVYCDTCYAAGTSPSLLFLCSSFDKFLGSGSSPRSDFSLFCCFAFSSAPRVCVDTSAAANDSLFRSEAQKQWMSTDVVPMITLQSVSARYLTRRYIRGPSFYYPTRKTVKKRKAAAVTRTEREIGGYVAEMLRRGADVTYGRYMHPARVGSESIVHVDER